MRHKRLLLVLAVLLALVTAVWRAPASLAANWLAENNHPLQLQLTEGTLWNGKSLQSSWQGLALGKSNWNLKGVGLKPMSLKYRIDTDSRQFHLAGIVDARSGGAVYAEQLEGRMPAAWIDLQSFIPFVFLAGSIEWQLDYLNWPASGVPAARGNFHWREAALTGLARVDLGALVIKLEESPGQLTATINSLEKADLMIDGQINSDGKQYTLNAFARISPAREDIFDMLAPMGKLQADGRILMHWTGNLFPQ